MDKTQLIMMAISALFGAVAKSLVAWFMSIIKTTKIVRAVTAKAKIAFSKSNRPVIFDLFGIAFYVAVLVNFALDKSEPTRFDILIAIGAAVACLIMAIVLLVDISKAIHATKLGE